MPPVNKKKKAETRDRAEETRNAAVGRNKARKASGSRTAYIIVAAVVAVALGVFAVAYYQTYVAPFRRAIVTVDDTVIRMGYFLDRARLSGSSGMGTLTALTNEQMVKYGAARYGILVTPDDIDRELRSRAAGSDNVTVGDAEFKEWYRQLLNENKVSSARYREVTGNGLLSSRFADYLALKMPSAIEHAHVYGITFGTYEEAAAAKERVVAGESFTAVATEIMGPPTEQNGGEGQWLPKGVYVNSNYDPFVLKAGEVSDPMAIMDEQNQQPAAYYIVTVDRFEVREVKADYLPELKNRVFQDWLAEEMKQHKVKWGGWDGNDKSTYGSVTDAWVNFQLSKGKPKS